MLKTLTKNKKILIGIISAGLFIIASVFLFIFVILPLTKNNESGDTGENNNFINDLKFEVQSVEIQYEGTNIENGLAIEFIKQKCSFNVVINNDEDNDKDKPDIKWEIIDVVGLNCKIDNEGNLTIGDTLGSLSIQVNVTSENTLSAVANINIIAPKTFYLQSLDAIPPQIGFSFIEGQTFDSNGLKVIANFFNGEMDPIQVYVLNYKYNENLELNLTSSDVNISYTHAGIERIASVPIIVIPKTLQSIEITKAPLTINYIEGQFFDKSGIEITAHYEYIDEVVNDYIITETDKFLLPETTLISVMYIANGVVKTANQQISVAQRTLQDIQIISPPNKTNYVQGQTFRTAGLGVIARYEYFDIDITSELILSNNGKLFHTDDKITVSYTENGITDSKEISIVVKRPYEEIRRITFENPLDATLTWIYSYVTDEGVSEIDNTELTGNSNLLFDSINGIYVAPVGAIITIRRVNPAVTDFIIDGEPYGMLYPSSSIDFELDFGDDMMIGFAKVLGERITVRFLGGESEQHWAFIYPLIWDAPMRPGDLAQISQIYEDNGIYYYLYTIESNSYSFSELSTFNITADTNIRVARVYRTNNNILNIFINYDSNVISVSLDKTGLVDLFMFPQITKVGYSLGFSFQVDGELLDNAALVAWVNTANNGDILYAVYTLTAEPQSGNIIGLWRATLTGSGILVFEIEFRQNGTYEYTVTINDNVNCKFTGIFTFADDVVKILSIQSNMEYQLVNKSDFNIAIINDELNATLFIFDGLSIASGQIDLVHVA